MCKNNCSGSKCSTTVAPGDYVVAYSLGYYYGRAFPLEHDAPMLAEDLYYRQTPGFDAGVAAGRRDFEEIDLVDEAMKAKVQD